MKVLKIVFALFLTASFLTNCKSEANKGESKENKETVVAKAEMLSLNVSGMSCEIGCAKTIESKLAKKEGVLEAKVVFSDSLATIKYDANKLDKASLIAFVEGVGDGSTYKASEKETTSCKKDCKMACCDKAEKKACKEDCKMACCTKKAKETACNQECKKECCTA
jgi:mercuric ion binding protein